MSAAKRLILIPADKGGTGKSTVARGLLEWYQRQDRRVTAVDSDKRNAQLYRYYHATVPVQRLDATTPQGLDVVFNHLAEATERVVLGTPAQFGDVLERLTQELPLGEILDTLTARITVVFVLARVKDSIQALKSALATLRGLPVDWVIVKHGHFGKAEEFARYDGSKTREDVRQAGGIELYLPDLQDLIYDRLDAENLPFSGVPAAAGWKFMEKQRVQAWLKQWLSELDPASAVL
jgi:hypothetical protein